MSDNDEGSVLSADGDARSMVADDTRAIADDTAADDAAEALTVDGAGATAADEVRDTSAVDGAGDAAVLDGVRDAAAAQDGRALAVEHTQVVIEQAERAAEAERSDDTPLGTPGRPLNRRSPFMMGLLGALGVAVTYGFVQLVISARDVLILIGLALFLAIGLDPAVRGLERWMRRWVAVLVVTLVMVGVVGGFLAAAIPPLVVQTEALVKQIPHYVSQLRDHSSLLGQLNDRYQLQQRAESLVSGGGGSIVNGVLGAGQMVIGWAGSVATVMVLTVYFLADLPRIRQLIYRLFPNSRRPRAILIGDEMFAKVGGFVLGNLITSLIAGVGTFVWLLIFGVPYPLLLALMVALLDLIPIVGSTVGGIIVSLIALSVSVPVAIATVAFYVFFRLAEDYILVPRVMGKAVEVPATVTFVAVLLGGAILGIIGALIAIPMAAAARIVLQQTVFPRLDRN